MRQATSFDGGLVYSQLRSRMGVGCFFGNTELSLELWNVIAGISRFDD